MKKIFLLTIAFLILSACSTPQVNVEGEWKLLSYGDSANPTPALPGVETSLQFDTNGQFGGTLGCNSFGGDFKLRGDKISFGSMISTMMFCELPAVQEQGVFTILSGGKDLHIQIIGSVLTITSADGLSVVNLERK